MYDVPVATPALTSNGGVTILVPSPTVGLTYDVGGEYPADPLRLMIAWANAFWKVTSTYNGK